jgi:hypothetical protein
VHELQADMAMNIMELCGILQWKERAEEWLCVLLANVMCLDVPLKWGKMKKRCSQKHFMSNQTVD